MRSVSEMYDIYHYDTGAPVAKKEEATFLRAVISPDSAADSLYQVKDYYLNGVLKFIGKSKSSTYEVVLDVPAIEYFPNGQKKRVCTFHNGNISSYIREYFPNGKLNTIKVVQDHNILLKRCLDSSGNVLTEAGVGKWIEYQDDYKTPFAEGEVKDGLEEGEWHGRLNDTAKYVCKYEKGNLTEGKTYGNSGKEYPFTEIFTAPKFNNGNRKEIFRKSLNRTISYPTKTQKENKRGEVTLAFIVTDDGFLTNIRIVKGVWPSIDKEIITTVSQGTPRWIPCYRYGIASSIGYKASISFFIDKTFFYHSWTFL